ncbi:MAG: DUF4292 domain-containing protein [Salegentibacter sp.]|uniref:DUF4292 domain-containing protein n=1 Tax=Salegentibacter sp. TaxID=1903072 RepID=UPI00286FC7B5|nr:DUF4292 domain-containing protein [Salegentibacter sp.]MDR9457540.1 DUF4292 domain-containing protein [Salegentibacter sp.]
MIRRIFVLFLLSAFMISCGSGRVKKGIATKDLEAAGIIAKHYENEPDFETLTARLRTVYQTEDKTQTVNLNFRMEKDKAIWISATILGFPMAKAYITPSSVSYYEKIGKTYFEGDFSLLSDILGTPLDFEKLQNLLLGQAIYDLRTEEYKFSQTPRGYQFLPVKDDLIKKMFLLNTGNLKAEAQQLAQEEDNRRVTVTYTGYQETSGKLFPRHIRIIANEGANSTHIELTYRSLEVNTDISFPFEIPSGYEEISVE